METFSEAECVTQREKWRRKKRVEMETKEVNRKKGAENGIENARSQTLEK